MMKIYAGIVAMALAATLPGIARSPRAQDYTSYRQCIVQFYDHHEYGWLAIQNTCNSSVTVAFATPNPSSVWGSMDLAPQQSKSTGHDRSEVLRGGGVEFYVCPLGMVPIDTWTKKVISDKTVTSYSCQQQ